MSSNGRPEAEVIVNYADGFAYSKYKMEEAFRPGGFLDKPPAKSPHAAKAIVVSSSSSSAAAPPSPSLKREDVDVIIHEFEIGRTQAEQVLSEHAGELKNALISLIQSPRPT